MFKKGDWVEWPRGQYWNPLGGAFKPMVSRASKGKVDTCYTSSTGFPRLRIEVGAGAFYHYFENEVDFITVEILDV